MGFRTGIHIETDGLHLDRVTEPAADTSLSVVVGPV
jgi:hypothetical protein